MSNKKKYDRIFTFGCSWTLYIWPTWADIIRYTDQSPQVYNWGLTGIGNVGIFHRMIECDLRNKFTENDLIIVEWTSWTREDRFTNMWQAYGNVFNTSYYDKEFIEKYWSWNNDVIKNSSCILAANKMFNIDYQFNMMPNLYSEGDRILPNEYWHKLYFDALPNLDSFPKNCFYFKGNLKQDPHPDIKNHLNFFNNNIKDRFGFTLEKNEDNILRIYDSIAENLKPSMDRNSVINLIKKEVQNFDFKWPYPNQGLR